MFSDGLDVVMEKVEEYYDKTAASHAYTFVMCVCFSLFNIHGLIFFIVLDPETKMAHFVKHWIKPLQDKVLESVDELARALLPITSYFAISSILVGYFKLPISRRFIRLSLHKATIGT